MKYCPTCSTRYDEEIIRFCTKDGTPLVNEEEPNFVAIPSENLPHTDEDDPGEVTIIRNNIPTPPPPPPDDDLNFEDVKIPPQRIVVSTEREQNRAVPPRPERQTYQAPPKKTNTLLVIVLTVLGTLVILGGGFGLVWLLQRSSGTDPFANSNAANVNTELPTNLGFDTNFNFNTNINANVNTNVNANANMRTPTPTPRPSATPTPSPTPEDDDTDLPPTNTNTRPPATPSPAPTLRTPATPSNRVVNGGMLNGRAINLSVPIYPAAARQIRASGQVMVEVSVDESGRVTSARAVSGHPLLRGAAEMAARQSRINPLRIDNETVKTTGVLLYNFRDN